MTNESSINRRSDPAKPSSLITLHFFIVFCGQDNQLSSNSTVTQLAYGKMSVTYLQIPSAR